MISTSREKELTNPLQIYKYRNFN